MEELADILYVMDLYRAPFILHEALFINKHNSESDVAIFFSKYSLLVRPGFGFLR
jgi:hypothetical protein